MNRLCRTILSANIILAHLFSYSSAGTIPSGYENIAWNSGVEAVMAKYPKGQLGKLADELIYRQYKPNQQIARRNFAFKNGKLHTVSLTFDKRYVEKHGIEKLLAEHSKLYGEAEVDRSQAPHMISCVWQSDKTRISFAYAPKRPDMTVVIYEVNRFPVALPGKELKNPS